MLTDLANYCNSYTLASPANSMPLIGVSANYNEELSTVSANYTNSIVAAGGIPVIIPVHTDLTALKELFAHLDGLLLTGGGDINPLYCHEEPIPQLGNVSGLRDRYDFMLLKLASDRQLPIFGICRGHQVINAFFGGSLFQDIYSQSATPCLKHSQTAEGSEGTHFVELTTGSKLQAILGAGKLTVNTFHHQAVKEVATGFSSSATASDGINEALESLPGTGRQIISVQWHPERMALAPENKMLKLFGYFVGQARLFQTCKNIHSQIVSIDSHVDTPLFFTEEFSIAQRENGSKISLPLMEEGHLDSVFMAAYLKQGPRDEKALHTATQNTISIIEQIKRQIDLNPEHLGLATSPADLYRLKQENKKAFFIGIENGYALGKDIHNVARFRDMGVRYITLCHNGANDLCDSAKGEPEHNGLSPFGRQVIKEMNRTGIMVDLSHASEKTFYDAISDSRTPVIASHSSARALCDHPRNLTDAQLKAIAASHGVVQVCLYHGFLSSAPQATLQDAIRHIDYITKLIGIDHVGIGSDFDGDGGISGCDQANEMINLTRELIKIGYTPEDLQKIWGGNLMRVMQTVLDFAAKS